MNEESQTELKLGTRSTHSLFLFFYRIETVGGTFLVDGRILVAIFTILPNYFFSFLQQIRTTVTALFPVDISPSI